MEKIEVKLEKWLKVLEKWVNQTQKCSNILLHPYGSEITILGDLNQYEKDLLEFFIVLNKWLQCQTSEKMIQLRLVARFISLCCKIPVILSRDLLVNGLLDVMITLSFSFRSAGKLKLYYYVADKLRTMISSKMEGIDLFLLEEFGISQEEYYKEHFFQISRELACVLCEEPINNADIETLHNVVDKDVFISIAEAILVNLKDLEIPQISESICKLPESLFNQMSLPALKRYYDINFSAFEKCSVNLVEKCVSLYPWVGAHEVLECLKGSRLLELFLHDVKYAYGVLLMFKNIAHEIGMHQSLITLLQITAMQIGEAFCSGCKICNMIKKLKFNIDHPTDHSNFDLSSFDLFTNEHFKKFKQPSFVFEVWFHLIMNKDLIDKIMVFVCSSESKDLYSFLRIILWYYIPFQQEYIEINVFQIASYITKLQFLLTKRHIELDQLSNLFLSVKDVSGSTILSLLLMFFFVILSTAKVVFTLENYKMMFDITTIDFVHCFLQTLDMLLNSKLLLIDQVRESFVETVKYLRHHFLMNMNTESNELTSVINGRCERAIDLLEKNNEYDRDF